jgi:hypothetical protein
MQRKSHLGVMAILLSALPSPAQIAAETARSTAPQHFICNTGYTQKDCDKEMLVLRKALANYRASELGEWTWVLGSGALRGLEAHLTGAETGSRRPGANRPRRKSDIL